MRSDSFAAELIKSFTVFLTGGFIYGLIEIIYRGHTHPSMFVLGGLCFLWVGGFDSFFRRTPPLWTQVLLGGLFITAAELICGVIFNLWLGLRVWDYSKLPFNLLGQICPMFCFSWIAISLPAIFAENALRSAFLRQAGNAPRRNA